MDGSGAPVSVALLRCYFVQAFLTRYVRELPSPLRPHLRCTPALEKYNIEKDIAAFIKKEFDKKYNPTWHCIVGRNFGSYVTHETKHFIYFYLGQVAILLFKSG